MQCNKGADVGHEVCWYDSESVIAVFSMSKLPVKHIPSQTPDTVNHIDDHHHKHATKPSWMTPCMILKQLPGDFVGVLLVAVIN